MEKPQTSVGGRSVIAAGSKIVGDLEFPGLVEILGTVHGNLAAGSVVVAEGALIEGSLVAANVTIRGRVAGRVICDTLTCHATADLTGEVDYLQLSIESGAHVAFRARRRAADRAADRAATPG